MSARPSVGSSSGRSSRKSSATNRQVNLISYAATDDTYYIKSVLYDTQEINIMELKN
jgi:hypothetical protein